MSLKAFHIFFVVMATLLCTGFGLWCVGRHMDGMTGSYQLLAAASFLGAIALVVYGRIFLQKMQGVSFL